MIPTTTRLTAILPLATIALGLINPTASRASEPLAIACPKPALAPVISDVPDRKNAPISIIAEAFEAENPEYAMAVGNVELSRADQLLRTETLLFYPQHERVSFQSPLIYQDSQVRLEASNGLLGLQEQNGDFHDVIFSFEGSSAHGEAESVHLSGGNQTMTDNIWFTTCPGEDPEWKISARELTLRHEEGIGVARGATLRLGKVPVLYAPYMTFPIDDRRKSGFLYPSLSTANDNGLEFGIPWYWNIAPNQDMTIEPRYYTERGLMLSGQYRLLTQRTSTVLEGEYLFDDDKNGEDRWHYLALFDVGFSPDWIGKARFEQVSDTEFFQDFGGSLAATSRQFLRSDASITGFGKYWMFQLMADDFQVIDESVNRPSEPYSRFPRLHFLLDAPLGFRNLSIDLDSELVYFDRSTGVVGGRFDIYPNLQWSHQDHWGYVRANAGYRYTSYSLDRRGLEGNESPDRSLPILSLDTGMYLDRLNKSGNTQTLEPRLFYLYVPYEDQDELPDFDTGELTFGFAQLFHYNRFVGADRQSDANQVTLALSTRSISNETGRESWSLGMGQIFYFTSPRVTLDEAMPENIDTAPFVGEFQWHPMKSLTTRLGIQWNWENEEFDVGVAAVDWQNSKGHRLGFEYRYRRERVEQFDVRYYWPINANWRAFTRWNFSLQDNELLEGLVGVEYESCCWAVRAIARQYLKDRNGGTRNALYLELSLKGLGDFGRRPPPLFHTPAP